MTKRAGKDADVTRILGMVRTIADKLPDRKALRVAKAALYAITAFVAGRFGVKEAFLMIDEVRSSVMEAQT